MKELTREKLEYYKKLLTECANSNNTEESHVEADDILSEFVSELGFEEIADIYNKVRKWYS